MISTRQILLFSLSTIFLSVLPGLLAWKLDLTLPLRQNLNLSEMDLEKLNQHWTFSLYIDSCLFALILETWSPPIFPILVVNLHLCSCQGHLHLGSWWLMILAEWEEPQTLPDWRSASKSTLLYFGLCFPSYNLLRLPIFLSATYSRTLDSGYVQPLRTPLSSKSLDNTGFACLLWPFPLYACFCLLQGTSSEDLCCGFIQISTVLTQKLLWPTWPTLSLLVNLAKFWDVVRGNIS